MFIQVSSSTHVCSRVHSSFSLYIETKPHSNHHHSPCNYIHHWSSDAKITNGMSRHANVLEYKKQAKSKNENTTGKKIAKSRRPCKGKKCGISNEVSRCKFVIKRKVKW